MLIKSITSAAAMLLALSVQAQIAAVHLTVQVPPSADTKNVYVAGSFNHWTAADSLYKMKKVNESTYTAVLPVYKGVKYEYKYTRGGWNNVEMQANDSSVKNRQFIASKRKYKVNDRVEKWNQPATTQPVSLQQMRMNAMKDSLLGKLQPRFDRMLALLKEYTLNQLQEKPDQQVDQRITDTLVHGFADMYGKINATVQKIFASLSLEQKKQVLQKLNDPRAEKDFINVLGAALSDVMKEVPINGGRPKQS
jgi:hypothetical protein